MITDKLLVVIPALLCITFHELCHGFVAYRLGDNTAKNAGRLTLNPIKHIDVIGLLMMIFVGFGWAKPVPVNMNNFKKPKSGMAVTALAGPVSNVFLAIVFLFLLGILYTPLANAGKFGEVILYMIKVTAYLSCALAVFNIIPISPLDGSKILFALLPEKQYYGLMRYEKYGMIVLLILVIFNILTPFLTTAVDWLYGGISGIATWAYMLTV